MAKGDDQRSRNQINAQGGLAQNNLNNLRNDTLIPQNQRAWTDYLTASEGNKADYANMMQSYNNYLAQNPYDSFIKNGGIGPEEAASIRARAISPTRAIYANAQDQVKRNLRLNPNSAVNSNAAMSRLARESSSAISDADTNAEAQLAGLRQSGREFGTSGEVGRQLNARQGMTSLYGTTPAQAAMFGNQVLQTTGQRLQGEGLQNELSNNIMRNQIDASRLPGKYDSTMGRINDIFNLAQKGAGFFT